MLSLSFLPWLVLILAIFLSIPITAAVESSRRKKALNAMSDDTGGDELLDEEPMEVVEEEMAPAAEDGGFDMNGGAFEGGENDLFADAGFDDDAFK